ncbi:SAM-dependent DNA methyltransferase [Clostridia bacterium]|nr:SAM-dependent DNA methyltransferase [Clostridia bacterium]
MAKAKKEVKDQPVEQALWAAADKLRKNMDAAEYKHIVLGLIFLKYISDNFYELYHKLEAGEGDYAGADPDDPYEYRAENVFYVPPQARWDYLRGRAKLATIGKDIDDAMDSIEKDNPSLQGVLPKEYAKEKLDKQSLGGLIDIISTIALGDSLSRSNDVLGTVYEYFLGQFALAEGKKGGQFYTPRCLVQLLVEMLEPYEGRVLDPCCGSGGMFVQSEKFIEAHADHYNGKAKEIVKLFESVVSVYGQESNQTTWRLCKMNLAMRGIDSSNVKWNNEGSFLNDVHQDLRSDFIITNPPFNDSDWSGELLSGDYRWKYGTPPASNANYAWIQHFISHLSPKGKAGFLLATKALASESAAEKTIRSGIVREDLVECIVLLPGKLFYTTPAPVSLWVLSRGKSKTRRKDETLFIDASKMFIDLDRTHRTLDAKIISGICETYHSWLYQENEYEDIPGYCRSVHQSEICDSDYSLYPGQYIGIGVEETDIKPKEQSLAITKGAAAEISGKMETINQNINHLMNEIQVELNKPTTALIKYKLSDVLEESTATLGNSEEPEILSITENAGLVLQRERFSKRVATEDTSSYKIVKKTDIVYNPYLLWAGAIDQCWVVDLGITSPAYVVLSVKQKFEPFLIGHVIKSDLMKKWYWNISIGTHERRRTAPVDRFLNLDIELPDEATQKRLSALYEELLSQKTLLQDTIKSIDVLSSGLGEFYTGL